MMLFLSHDSGHEFGQLIQVDSSYFLFFLIDFFCYPSLMNQTIGLMS
jgi:hypothetical protein